MTSDLLSLPKFFAVLLVCSCFYVVKMVKRCVAARCNNTADPKKGISMHKIHFADATCRTKQRRRKKWLDFVRAKRKNWRPGKISSLWSMHFKEEDFAYRLDSSLKRILKTDEVGISVFSQQSMRNEKK